MLLAEKGGFWLGHGIPMLENLGVMAAGARHADTGWPAFLPKCAGVRHAWQQSRQCPKNTHFCRRPLGCSTGVGSVKPWASKLRDNHFVCFSCLRDTLAPQGTLLMPPILCLPAPSPHASLRLPFFAAPKVELVTVSWDCEQITHQQAQYEAGKPLCATMLFVDICSGQIGEIGFGQFLNA